MTERDIFLAVLDLADSAEQSAYLDRMCGNDPVLRERVESLFRSHRLAGDFLSHPAVSSVSADGMTEEIGGDGPRAGDQLIDEVKSFLLPSDRPEALGRIGHYDLLEVLGRGGFGIVFRAMDDVLKRVVAVKVLAPALAATSPARKRFLREARSSAAIRHENVIQVYAVEEQPLPYLVMEYIPGETLQQRLDRTGPLGSSEIVEIGRQIAHGLAAAHATGLVHRDIKPCNILIEEGPARRVKITDFGLARAADDASLTQSGVLAGTPMFMAPEQARGDAVDHRADLFSLGSVLYTMISGRPPFRARHALGVMRRVTDETPRPITEIIPEAPHGLCKLIERLHAKEPGDRCGSAQEVADALDACLAEPAIQQGSSSPMSVLTPAATPIGDTRHSGRRWLTVAAALMVGLVGFGVAEATDVTNVRGTVIKLFSPNGTLAVEVDDPSVSVTIDGEDLVISGAGVKEIRLKPGQYRVSASKDGKVVRQEMVRIERHGKQVVRVTREPAPAAAITGNAWEEAVAALPAAEQVKAVATELKKLNPEFDGNVQSTVTGSTVTGLEFDTRFISNIAPVRALAGLQTLVCEGRDGKGELADLGPLEGLKLTSLNCSGNTRIADLTPLGGMPLRALLCRVTIVSDLSPIAECPITHLECGCTQVTDLTPISNLKLERLVIDHLSLSDLRPLKNMPLTSFHCAGCAGISDLSPLQGKALTYLHCGDTRVTDLSVIRGMPLREIVCDFKADQHASLLRSVKTLKAINYKATADFWNAVPQD